METEDQEDHPLGMVSCTGSSGGSGDPEQHEETPPGSSKDNSEKDMKPKSQYFIAIHLGAGKHSFRKKDTYKTLCKSACDKGISILKRGGSAEDAVVAATVILENSGLVNAGRGSNLTMDKTVECDAGFMDGEGHFGGVGGVSGVPNPILIALKLVELQCDLNKLSHGRVPPNFLTGQGAKKWAESQGISTCDEEKLVSKSASKTYDKYIKIINEAGRSPKLSQQVADTVGAIAMDRYGKVASAVSSGGNWLKFPGRVGHSPQFGSGCWAANPNTDSNTAIAISTTGVGEMLAKVQWARECADSLQDPRFTNSVEAISTAMKEKFLESDLLRHHSELKIVGMIGLNWDGNQGEFIWGHTSETLIVGYAGSRFKKCKMEFSVLPVRSQVGKTVNVGAIPI